MRLLSVILTIYKDRPYANALVEKTGIAAGLDIQEKAGKS